MSGRVHHPPKADSNPTGSNSAAWRSGTGAANSSLRAVGGATPQSQSRLANASTGANKYYVGKTIASQRTRELAATGAATSSEELNSPRAGTNNSSGNRTVPYSGTIQQALAERMQPQQQVQQQPQAPTQQQLATVQTVNDRIAGRAQRLKTVQTGGQGQGQGGAQRVQSQLNPFVEQQVNDQLAQTQVTRLKTIR